MASERTSRPGGFGLPGFRDSGPTGASRPGGHDAPSRAEVQQRIHSLYDRAETDSGTFNATRAVAAGNSKRGNPAAGGERRRTDPTLDAIARQWFDAARANLGPIVAAALPADRMPIAEERPTVPAQRIGDDLGSREPGGRPLPELTAGPAGRATARPLELTAGPVAALPAAPEPLPQARTPKALPASAAKPSSSAPRSSKERSRRKLAAARELLFQHTARQSMRLPALEPAAAEPVRPVAERPAEWQQPPALDPGSAFAAPAPAVMEPPLVTDAFTAGPAFVAPSTFAAADALTAGVPTGGFTGAPAFPTTEVFGAAETYPGITPADTTTGTPAADTFPATDAFAATGTYPGITPATGAFASPVAFPEAFPGADVFVAPDAFAGTTGGEIPVGVGAVPGTGYETKAAQALAFARAQIGRPCVWGAAGPDSYDAPGLTQSAWKAAGVALPRTAQEQGAMGTTVPLTDIRPGDLIFFYDTSSHVGVYTGDAMMIHAPGPGSYIREESIFFAGNAAIHGAVRPA
ncbi:NlpC/P60 family protein [Streptomyces sp. NPDC004589]|uniref:C40 family peptidase n=1 Tax=Streptomyces sp. NPDC004589 TaxID=3154553 RepID=UPI0033AECDE5